MTTRLDDRFGTLLFGSLVAFGPSSIDLRPPALPATAADMGTSTAVALAVGGLVPVSHRRGRSR